MADDIYGGATNAEIASGSTSISETSSSLAGVADATGSGINSYNSGLYGFANNIVGTDPNTLASAFRAYGIPLNAEPDYNFTPTSAEFAVSPEQQDWRVKISCDLIMNGSSILSPLQTTGGMIFPYLPTITISHSANYQQMDITHNNYPFFAYRNSQVDEISITGKFTVQNQEEAKYWVASIHFLRTVTKMFFGQGPNLGNPPPICTLNGYGDYVYKDVSCVIKSFQATMPNDVDYIGVALGSTGGGAGQGLSYAPVSSDITVVVQPVYSREKIKSFDLTKFANGDIMLGSDGKGFI